MVRIYLHEAASYRGCTVTRQDYKHCSLFYKYDHVRTGWIGVDYIYVYKEYELWRFFVTYFTLDPYYSFPDQALVKSEVYYNVFDTKREHPLLLVLYFKPGKLAHVRYLKFTEFIFLVRGGSTRQLGTLQSFSGPDDKEILEALIVENDFNNRNLTYQIDLKSNNNRTFYYNVGRVVVSFESVIGKSGDKSHGFSKHIHTPANKKPNVSFVLYNKEVPLLWNGNQGKLVPINEIQNQVYSRISMYYSNKVKEPLMFELVKETEGREEVIYYFTKRHEKHLYWQLLDSKSYREILREWSSDKDVHYNLVSNENKLLITFLKKVESYLIKTLVIILDKHQSYSESEAVYSLRKAKIDTDNYMLVNRYSEVTVKNASETCHSLATEKFIVYEHDFSKIFKFLQPNELVRLKFIRYSTELMVKDDILTIRLDNRGDYDLGVRSYYSLSSEILVSSSNNLEHGYTWYRHSLFKSVISGVFDITFDGQTLKLNNDLNSSYSKNLVIIYFKTHNHSRFVLVVFTTTDFKKVRYFPYSDFRKNVLARNTVKLSTLKEIQADISTRTTSSGIGYLLDNSLLKVLNEEYEKIEPESSGVLDTIDHQPGHNKLYVYSFLTDDRPLMFCYRNAYSIFYFGRNSALWKQVSDINKCICNNFNLSDYSDKKFLQTLKEIATLLGLMEPEIKVDREIPPKRIEAEIKREEIPQQKIVPDKPIEIDISITNQSVYDSNRVKLTEKQVLRESNLFCSYTHSLVSDAIFNISSLLAKVNSQKKTVNLEPPVSNVRSIDVYFNIFIGDVPILLSFYTNTQTKYYKFEFKPDKSFTIVEDSIIYDLAERLIRDSDRINNTVTYELNRITHTLTTKYGYNDGITLTKQENVNSKGYTVFTHSPISKSNKAYVLYNQQLLASRSDNGFNPYNEIQEKQYTSIKLYVLDSHTELPFLIQLHQTSSSLYLVLTENKPPFYWNKELVDISNSEKIISKLNNIYYYLKSSIILEIDKGGGTHGGKTLNYPLKTIENKIDIHGKYKKSRYTDAQQILPPKDIIVSHPAFIFDLQSKGKTTYIYVSHEVPKFEKSDSDSSFSNISGIRLFISKGADLKSEEIFLYENVSDATQSKNKMIIPYFLNSSSSNKFYFYFHDKDPRPLFMCYDRKGYKPLSKEDITKWIHVGEIKKCPDDANILSNIRSIYRKMERKMIFVVSKTEEKNINKSPDQPFDQFQRDIYKPDSSKQSGPFILPKSSLLPKDHKSDSNIEKLFNSIDDKTFDIVNVYKNKSGSSLKDIFVFEFIDESSKTHFQRKDIEAKYWVEQNYYHDEDTFKKQLSVIKSNLDKTIVFEIDKIDNYNNYINIDKRFNHPVKDFNKFVHDPKTQHTNKNGLILYNGEKLILKKQDGHFESIDQIQDLSYKNVSVFFGSLKPNFPLIVEFTQSSSHHPRIYYKHRIHNLISYWESLQIRSRDHSGELIFQLKMTEIDLFGSLFILMDHFYTKYGEHETRKILHQTTPKVEAYLYPMDSNYITVDVVTNQTQGRCLKDTGFTVYEHTIDSCVKENDLCGIRFLMPTVSGTDSYTEIKLYRNNVIETLNYKKSNSTSNAYIYYSTGISLAHDNLHPGDPRPLLLCFGGDAYIPKKLTGPHTTKSVNVDYTSWVYVNGLNNCFCTDFNTVGNNSKLLNTLTDVARFLNPVEINPRMIQKISSSITGSYPSEQKYIIDTFRSTHIQIKIRSRNLKCYRQYTYLPHDFTYQGSSYRLGNLAYTDNTGNTFPINYSSSNYNYRPLISVSVFYYVFDYDHNYPLLIILRFAKGDSWYDDNSKFIDCYKLSSKFSDRNKEWQPIHEHGDERDFLKNLTRLYEESTIPEDFMTGVENFGQLDSMSHSQPDSEKPKNELDDLIEEKLYSIRTKLEIEFSDDQKNKPLFDPKHCSEGGTNTAAAIGGGVGGVVGTVGTTVGVTALVRPELFIPVINALT